jgi:hypothetical protein
MTITLSEDKPYQAMDGEYTAGDQATIFFDEDSGEFGYRYHGVRRDGTYYQSADHGGFESKQSALKDVLDHLSKGLGC